MINLLIYIIFGLEPFNILRFYPNIEVQRNQIIIENRIRRLRLLSQVIYLIYCITTNKFYIGSAINGSIRLSHYYYPSTLKRNRRIYNSLVENGHKNHSLIILEDLGSTFILDKIYLLKREQYYLNLLFQNLEKYRLNVAVTAGSTAGIKIPVGFSEKRSGILSAMFNREKSPEFKYQIYRDKTGINNPQFGIIKSEATLNKIRKIVYVYDNKHTFLAKYGRVACKFHFKIGYDTLRKYIDSGKTFKGYYFYSKARD